MPYIIKPISSETVGTRTVKIEHVVHVRGGFSGPARPVDSYFSVTGSDSADDSYQYCPPGCARLEEAQAVADAWVSK